MMLAGVFHWWDVALVGVIVGIGFLALLPSLLAAGGAAAGALGKGRADARASEADAITRKYMADVDKYRSDLNRYEMELATPGALASTALRGDLIKGLQDVSLAPHPRAVIPRIAGGVKPSSMITPSSRLLGEAMNRQALMRQLTAYGPPTGPGEPTYPKASGLDKALGILGLVGAGAGAWYGAKNLRNAYTTPPVMPPPVMPPSEWDFG